jgi:hypothetical protein
VRTDSDSAVFKYYELGLVFRLTPLDDVSKQACISFDALSIPLRVGLDLNENGASICTSENNKAKGDDFQIY